MIKGIVLKGSLSSIIEQLKELQKNINMLEKLNKSSLACI